MLIKIKAPSSAEHTWPSCFLLQSMSSNSINLRLGLLTKQAFKHIMLDQHILHYFDSRFGSKRQTKSKQCRLFFDWKGIPVKVITELIGAPVIRAIWCQSGCCAASQSQPVYVHKTSAAFTLPVFSQAEHTAPVPEPTGYLRHFLIWARYLFISNPFLLMPVSKSCIFISKTYQYYVSDPICRQYSLKKKKNLLKISYCRRKAPLISLLSEDTTGK